MRFFEVVLSGAALISAALAVEFNSWPESVKAGEAITLTYSPKDVATTIILRKGPSTDLDTLDTITTSSTSGSFTWTIPSSLGCFVCVLHPGVLICHCCFLVCLPDCFLGCLLDCFLGCLLDCFLGCLLHRGLVCCLLYRRLHHHQDLPCHLGSLCLCSLRLWVLPQPRRQQHHLHRFSLWNPHWLHPSHREHGRCVVLRRQRRRSLRRLWCFRLPRISVFHFSSLTSVYVLLSNDITSAFGSLLVRR
ncbi:hypothetical protein P171DRAFT_70674 [Karstenula rhodostoma CBS 690.94]|uniref:Yeast cell wall synthesis Kre9/Knh1-like N-terminal domain-containing protein n=1 Tax=Karstenula rhodostoma CBS 690.94 TaxID=1392251 RepID=A0A9P4PGA1_9PLEO|nr:hypothetical protein P171DRAFT_70674 [Karstenula rhodostoma CBS 690.94]